MTTRRRRKCRHCGQLFRPDPRNLRHQRYCSAKECRRASKAASQRRWLAKAENRDYFRGPEQMARVTATMSPPIEAKSDADFGPTRSQMQLSTKSRSLGSREPLPEERQGRRRVGPGQESLLVYRSGDIGPPRLWTHDRLARSGGARPHSRSVRNHRP